MTWSIRFHMQLQGNTIALTDVLAGIPDNDWDWRLWDLYAIGHAPHDLSMPDFERVVIEAPRGYSLSWTELLDLAVHLEDTYDCLLTAAASDTDATAEEVMAEDYSRLIVTISAEDSTCWRLFSNLGGEAGQSLQAAWRSLTEHSEGG
jgi:hypothetical protein